MKVIAVNKFYYKKGGSETYYFALNNLLAKNNIEVIPFSMKDTKNVETDYEDYFINNISYDQMSVKEKLINSFKLMYSFESKNKISKIIKDTKPDIAHLHVFQHQITPSILYEFKRNNIKIVNTVHDLKIICPNYKMLNKNGICEQCKGGRYYNCVKNSCVKNSKLKSIICMNEAYLNKVIRSYTYVDKFICPSRFYKDKLIEFGIDKNKVVNIPNFININEYEYSTEEENYFIYIGRLSEEKGIKTLLYAMQDIKCSKLYVIGQGSEEDELKHVAQKCNLKNVYFLGIKNGEELKKLFIKSKFIVVPSVWYENCPMVILEAMAYGKPVIGSNIGGIPELVRNNVTGLIFEADNELDLRKKILYLLQNDQVRRNMGIAARCFAYNEYNEENHFKQIKRIYEALIN